MPHSIHLPGYRWLWFLQNVPVRVGIYTGICLSVFFSAWLFVANRMPLLEPFALARNVAAVVILVCIACIPFLRFYRSPGELLVSGLIGWMLLSLTYRLLCLAFPLLDEKYSAFHVFVLGAVVYMIGATLSWLGTIIYRARTAHGSHSHH
jgi:hypothetical protein